MSLVTGETVWARKRLCDKRRKIKGFSRETKERWKWTLSQHKEKHNLSRVLGISNVFFVFLWRPGGMATRILPEGRGIAVCLGQRKNTSNLEIVLEKVLLSFKVLTLVGNLLEWKCI